MKWTIVVAGITALTLFAACKKPQNKPAVLAATAITCENGKTEVVREPDLWLLSTGEYQKHAKRPFKPRLRLGQRHSWQRWLAISLDR